MPKKVEDDLVKVIFLIPRGEYERFKSSCIIKRISVTEGIRRAFVFSCLLRAKYLSLIYFWKIKFLEA
jgi:hypothetical protein